MRTALCIATLATLSLAGFARGAAKPPITLDPGGVAHVHTQLGEITVHCLTRITQPPAVRHVLWLLPGASASFSGGPRVTCSKKAHSDYNGSYDGTIATTFAGSNTAHSVAFQFTVAQGVIRDFAKGNSPYSFSSPTIVNGQASMVLKAPDGSLSGTLFFVMSANGGVAVHGTLTGTIAGSALSDAVTARRTYPR